MMEILKEREERLHEFFNLPAGTKMLNDDAELPEITPEIEEHLKQFNIEWHIIPAENALPRDEELHRRRFYPTHKGETRPHEYQKTSSYKAIFNGHRKHQGRILGIETTMKPRY